VDLQQIDIFHVQASQAVINGAKDLRPGEAFCQIAHLMVHLGGDYHFLAASEVAQRLADDLFAAAIGVAVGGIKEVNAALESVFDDRTAALFRQRPGVLTPVRLAKRHAAQTKTRNLKICFS